jgi:ABC-2 type transport system permease protein
MSAAEATAVAPPRRRTVSSRFFRSELRLVFGRRRNQIGLAVLAAVPILISIAIKTSASRPGQDAPDFFASITQNGLFLALAALTIELALFLPIAIAAIAGDAVAGEANTGTLRYLLTVPVSRTRLLAVKYAAIVVGAMAAAFVVTVTGIVMGLILFGGGDVVLLSGTVAGFWDGLLRVLGATVYVGIGLAALGAVGLFFSTLTEQPIGAMIATVLFSTASYIADTVPQIDWMHPYLIIHNWMAYGDLLRDPVSWSQMGDGLWVALGYAVVFWLLAWARFGRKDVTS